MEFYKNIYYKLEKVKGEIGPSDFNFYNLAHFPLLAKYSEKNALSCKECSKNMKELEKITDALPGSLTNNAIERKTFETQKSIIEEHLKKKHKMRFPGFYLSLCTFMGLIVAFVINIFVNTVLNNQLLNDLTLILLSCGLLIGIYIGRQLDKKIFIKNLQL